MKRKSVGLCALTLTIFFSAASLVHANEPDYLKNYPGPASAILRSLGLNDDALRSPSRNSGMLEGHLIVLDTRDIEACRKVQSSLLERMAGRGQDLTGLCRLDSESPYASVLVFEEVESEVFRRRIDISQLKSTERTLVQDTRNSVIAMGAAMGILWLLPESISKWDREEIRRTGFLTKYKENVKNGPVIDKDDPLVNYVGHPLSGAAYYTMARHRGSEPMAAFGFSVLMSTFFWEYGFEALAEKPSIQDLIITPVVGSIMGELFYQAEQKILANGGKLLGSQKLGSVAMVVLNPLGTLSNKINRAVGSKFIQSAEADFVVRRRPIPGLDQKSNYVGIELKFTFW